MEKTPWMKKRRKKKEPLIRRGPLDKKWGCGQSGTRKGIHWGRGLPQEKRLNVDDILGKNRRSFR